MKINLTWNGANIRNAVYSGAYMHKSASNHNMRDDILGSETRVPGFMDSERFYDSKVVCSIDAFIRLGGYE
jgi:hypothetical protein